MPRNLAMAGLLGAAVGGPYLMENGPEAWPTWTANSAAPAEATPATVPPHHLRPPNTEAPHGPGSEVYRRPAPLEGRVVHSLDEVLRWEVTKDWVFRSWDRKSTGLADPTLFGVRVPVVTGAAMTDIAGALSYYFDAHGVLKRIRLVGTTADTTRLAHLAASRFGMRRRVSQSPGEQLFQLEEGGRVRSELRTHPEPVLWGTSPHNSFRVELELNRPESEQWFKPPRLPFTPPSGTTASQGEAVAAAQQPQEQPFLPPRSVVPDEAATAATASTAPTGATSQPPPAANTAQPSAGAAPTASPEADVAPLQSYRQRFRWPE